MNMYQGFMIGKESEVSATLQNIYKYYKYKTFISKPRIYDVGDLPQVGIYQIIQCSYQLSKLNVNGGK